MRWRRQKESKGLVDGERGRDEQHAEGTSLCNTLFLTPFAHVSSVGLVVPLITLARCLSRLSLPGV